MKTITLFLAIFLLTKVTFASIVLEGTSSGSISGTSSLSIEHTISSGNMLIVAITSKDKTISTVEWDNTPLELGSEVTQNSMNIALYFLRLPANGTNNVNITTSGVTDISAIVTSYSGVDLNTPFGVFSTLKDNSLSATITVEGSSNDIVIDAIGCKNQTPLPDESQIMNDLVGSDLKIGSSRKEINESTNMSWTMNEINDWGMIGVALKSQDALPITLLNFNANPTKSSVEISWSTGSEKNNNFFTIQRSSDGINFEDISTIKGSGNSNKITYYSYSDKNPASGINYYRLNQTDFDEHLTKSEIISISFTDYVDNINFSVFPNPLNKDQNLNINIQGIEAEKEVLIVVKNILGEELYSKVTFSNFQGNVIEAIDKLDRLPSGTYFIIASSKNNAYNKKLIIR